MGRYRNLVCLNRRSASPGRRPRVFPVVAAVFIVMFITSACGGGSTGSSAGSASSRAATATGASGGSASVVTLLRSDLQSYLATRGKAEHISAVALRVSFPRGRSAINLAAGTMQYGGGALLPDGALWQVGSNTKAFTSVILLQLEAEGKLSINDTLGKWLPQYEAWRDITIKQLLNMTSRIPDVYDQLAYERAYAADPNAVFSAAQMVSYVVGLPLEPEGYNYSNTNYILAEMIIEKVTHDTYADQLTRRIIDPLHLHDMCYGAVTCPATAAARMPSGYFFNPEVPGLKPLLGKAVPKLQSSPDASGGIISTLADLTTWDRALYQAAELPPTQQRQLESLVSLKTGKPITGTTISDPAGFGLGVAQFTSPGTGTFWGYEGTTFGYRVQHFYLPGSGVIIVLAANSSPANDEINQLGATVYQTLQKAGVLTRG